MKKIKQKPFIQAVQECMGECDQHIINLKNLRTYIIIFFNWIHELQMFFLFLKLSYFLFTLL